MNIFTSGRIDNLTKEDAYNWRNYCKEKFNEVNIKTFIPDMELYRQNGCNEVWDRDLFFLDKSDVILVNLEIPSNIPFIGTSIEISRAFYLHKPIIAFSSQPWVYNHPTFKYFCTVILNDIDEAIDYIKMNYNI